MTRKQWNDWQEWQRIAELEWICKDCNVTLNSDGVCPSCNWRLEQ